MAALNVDFEVAELPAVPGMSKGAKKHRQSKKPLKGGKRGNPGHFHGTREVFLDNYQPEFKILRGKPHAIQAAFWARIFGSYWAAYGWWIPIDVEPEDYVGEEPLLDTEEAVEEKKNIIELTQSVRAQIFSVYCRDY